MVSAGSVAGEEEETERGQRERAVTRWCKIVPPLVWGGQVGEDDVVDCSFLADVTVVTY